MALRRAMPALLTRMETGPTLVGDLRRDGAAVVAVGDVERKLVALPPAAVISAAVFSAASPLMSSTTTLRALARIAQRDGAADAGSRAGDRGDVV